MGNWRTVTIIGSISAEDAPAARQYINIGKDYDRFHCLCNTGSVSLCGLDGWMPAGGGQIRAVGNLSERDYGVEDVAEVLTVLAGLAPSLALKVHCGGEWESDECIATVTVADGTVTTGPPERATVGEGLSEIATGRLFQALVQPAE
jgi:hypothetical protein